MSPRTTKKEQHAISPAPSVLDAVNASRGTPTPPVVEQPPIVIEHVQAPKAPEAAQAPQARKAPEQPKTPAAPKAPVRKPEPAAESGSVDDLGHYVTRVMADARRAAAEFLASVDVDAARRASIVTAQADAEARSVLDAAAADADKIRSDARLEGDRLIAQRLRIAIDLTDQLYNQANRILADADRPDVARQQLARFVSELTQTAEDAAAAASLVDKPRS